MSADFDSSAVEPVEPREGERAAARLQTALSDLLAGLQSRDEKTDERYSLLCERLAALESRLSTIPAQEHVSSSAVLEQRPRAVPVERSGKARTATEPATDSEWESVLFGLEMATSDLMTSLRSALVADLKRGDCAALAFLGQLLLFRSAEAERMAPLLKDLGETYYAWSAPRGDAAESERQAFVAWLVRRCGAVGVSNVIELVHVGDRVDLARHFATGRGVDVAAVHGWVVLRDNGKVYTKASITAR
jgi:hypothetical protein